MMLTHSFMSRWLLSSILLCLALPMLRAQSLVADLEAPVERGMAEWEVWGSQRSNALSSGTIHTFIEGGFLSRDFFKDALALHPALGGMGVDVGWSKRWTTRPLGQGSWALTGSFGSEVLVSSLWRKELMELTFLGNAGHTGRVDIMNGTGVRAGAFNRFSLGMENTKTRQRLELSLVQRMAGAEWGIPNGSFWVSEEADSMQVNVLSYALASLNELPDTNGLAWNQTLPAYGVGISGALPLTSEMWPLQFHVDFRDIGILFEPAGGMVAFVDTGISTTGLSVPLTSYIDDGLDNEQGLTWQNIVDGNTGYQLDSILLVSDSASSRMMMLPSRVQASLTWWPSPDVQIRAKVRAGSWMPSSEYTLGVGWIPGKRLAFGLDFRSGGWGGPRPVTWLKLRISEKRILSLEVDDPAGWFWGQEVAANTYGRGVRFSLQRLPGAGWSRFMGLPSRDLRKPLPRVEPVAPKMGS